MFYADKPISSEKEDVLGFSSFANALAVSLTSMSPDDGIVISIEGEWGTGKTSAIQLTERRLIILELAREKNVSVEEIESCDWSTLKADWVDLSDKRRMHIIRFNPWNFSGQENLVRAFFTEVGAVVGHPSGGAIAKAIKKITDYLPTIGTVAGAGGGLLLGGAPAAGAGAAAAKAVGEGIERFVGSPQSLETAKRELASALQESGKRLVVIIDDLDRLMPTEMRAMFSLVKSLGDLPNLLYVLSFDRRVVTSVLMGGSEPIEPEFLEKIVQVQLKLPPPWQPEIRTLFFDRINRIIGDATPNDHERWQRVFHEVVTPYIRSPRDVARFANTLQVIWPNVAGDVDIADIIVLTTLQLCEPAIFDQIFAQIEELAGEEISFEKDEDFAARYEPSTANNSDAAKRALAHLFPKLAKGWNLMIWDNVPFLKKLEQRRICTKYYRNYFLFGRDPDRFSREEIESILADNQSSQERITELIDRVSELKSKRGISLVAIFLDQISEIVFSKPLLKPPFVTALLNLSDRLILREDRVWEFFVEDNLERLTTILTLGLVPLDQSERDGILELLKSNASGITLACLAIGRLAEAHGLPGGDARTERERLISYNTAKEAIDSVAIKIRALAARHLLLNQPRPMLLIFIWRQIVGVDEVRIWLKREMGSDESILLLAQKLPSTSFRTSGDERSEVRSFKASTYEEILDVDYFKKRLASVVAENPTLEAYKLVQSDFLNAERIGSEE